MTYFETKMFQFEQDSLSIIDLMAQNTTFCLPEGHTVRQRLYLVLPSLLVMSSEGNKI